MNWQAKLAALKWDIRPFVNGRYVSSDSDERISNINPANEDLICDLPAGNAKDVDVAVACARERFEQGVWSELPPGRRGEVLFKLADLLVAHKDELALLDCVEMGKPIQGALYDAQSFAPTMLRAWAGFADKLLGSCAPINSSTLSFNTYEPRGVVGAIVPWNFPTLNAIYKLAPALAAGNTVVLKPSELASGSALRIAELALEAGVPEGVLNIVPGLGLSVGSALSSHPDIDMLSFTGSTATGRKIMELAARSNGKPVLLELGGKSPHVVFDDVDDLDAVARAVVEGMVWNQCQVCSAHTRLLIQESFKDKLLEKVVALASAYEARNPLDEATTFGPLASPVQRDRVKKYVEQGIAAGAVPVLKGSIRDSGGCYVNPTIFDRVTPNMAIVREEIFGPVLCVQQFRTEAEAIALANNTEYGLAATVWTRDMGRGKRLARSLKVAGVSIRTSGEEGPHPGYVLSYEPRRSSGFGSEIGLQGLQSYSTLKIVVCSGR